MGTLTPNLGLSKPDIMGDEDEWGEQLNADLDILDAQLGTLQSDIAAVETVAAGAVQRAGDTMGGPLVLAGDATANLQPVTLRQLDGALAGLPAPPATLPPSGPAGGDLAGSYPDPVLAATAVTPGSYSYAAISVDAKGRLISAANGAPPPGPAVAVPLMDGVGAVGASALYARQDHVHASDTSRLAVGTAAGGDLTGSFPNPVLTTTGVAAGSYTNSNVTIDAKGRITAASNGASGGGSSVTIASTPPSSPKPGDLWWDDVGGNLFVWFQDVDSGQWVVANNPTVPPQWVQLTQAEYDALSPPDPNTLYVVVG